MEQPTDLLQIPYVRPGTGRLVRVLHLSPDHKAEIYEKPESLWATQYLFVMVVFFKDKVVGMLAAEASLVASTLLSTFGLAAKSTKAALVSYHVTSRMNHGMSESYGTLDGFKSAAASKALDLIFPNTKGELYYVDSKDPIPDPRGIPEEYLAQFANLRSKPQEAASRVQKQIDPEVQKALEHMFTVALGLLSAGKSPEEAVHKLAELGCPSDIAKPCVEAASATLAERQRAKK